MTDEKATRYRNACNTLNHEHVEFTIADDNVGLLRVYDDNGDAWLYYSTTGTIMKASNKFKPKRKGLVALLQCVHGCYEPIIDEIREMYEKFNKESDYHE